MTSILKFPEPCAMTQDAAIFELGLAEVECESIRRAMVDARNAEEDFQNYYAERFRAARDRLHTAQDLAREVRWRWLGRRCGAIWQ